MHAAMKEAYSEQTFAFSTIFRWHQQFTQGRASASPKPKSGRLVAASTEAMLADDNSLSQQQIALVGILQTTVKKIFSLFSSLKFPCLCFHAKHSYGRSICFSGLIVS